MDGARMAKSVFFSKLETRHDIWRPKLRWLDDVEGDIKALGIRRWRIKAQDRNEWTAIKREAKVKLKGPWSHRRRKMWRSFLSIYMYHDLYVSWSICIIIRPLTPPPPSPKKGSRPPGVARLPLWETLFYRIGNATWVVQHSCGLWHGDIFFSELFIYTLPVNALHHIHPSIAGPDECERPHQPACYDILRLHFTSDPGPHCSAELQACSADSSEWASCTSPICLRSSRSFV
jgi:hypothetical protein